MPGPSLGSIPVSTDTIKVLLVELHLLGVINAIEQQIAGLTVESTEDGGSTFTWRCCVNKRGKEIRLEDCD